MDNRSPMPVFATSKRPEAAITISIVTTLYYSAPYVQEFYFRSLESIKKITDSYEIIFVNDGSPDKSLQLVLSLQKNDKNVVAIDLSRNFGHHRALMTGLQHARGDYVFMTDSDLEEAPELLNVYWEEMCADQEADVIYGVQGKRKGGLIERISGTIWYSIFSALSDIPYPADSLTSRLMSRRYVDSVANFRESELELWGVFVLAGFKQKAMVVSKGHKGSSTYTFRKRLRVAVESITAFSSRPLLAIFVLGLSISSTAFFFIVYLLVQRFVYKEITEGWTSILVSVWFVGGLLIFCVGIIGVYLSKMFLEIKNRPLTVIRNIYRAE